MKTDPITSALEQMDCAELVEIIQLNLAIQDADAAGLDGWAMSLRSTLARIIQSKNNP